MTALAVGCGPERTAAPPETPDRVGEPAAELPPELADPQRTPPADLLLPPLEDHATDDDAEPGELAASLDHGDIPYVEVMRRLIRDDQGFASAEVAVITLEPEADAATRILEHRYGDAPRRPVQLAGVEMQRVEAQPHAVLAWVGPTFVVTFERGQQRTHAWLESLAEATLRAIAAGGGR